MLTFQPKVFVFYAKKQKNVTHAHTHSNKTLKESRGLLKDIEFKKTTINMLKDIKETMLKKLKDMITMPHQIEDINKEIELLKRTK